MCIRDRYELLGNNCIQYHRKLNGNLTLLISRKDIDDSVDRVGSSDGVQSGQKKVSGLCCGHCYINGLVVAHFPEKDDIRTLAEGGAKCGYVILCIDINFTLAYNSLVMAMQEFQRFFQRNNMFLLGFVNFINNTGKGSSCLLYTSHGSCCIQIH